MLAILICVIQITAIAVVASIASAVSLKRAPHLSAHFCWLGIVLSACVVAVTYIGAPRLWTFAGTTADAASRVSAVSVPQDSGQPGSFDADASGFEFSVVVSVREAVGRVAQFRQQNPKLDAGIVNGCQLVSLVLCLLLLTRLAFGCSWLWRLRRSQCLSTGTPAYQTLDALVRTFGITGPVSVRVSRRVSSPCVSWLSRRTIYVPDDFEHWTVEEHRAAFAHELAHQMRRDPLSRLFAELCLSLVCFHPLMLWLRRQLVFAQERATDQYAASRLGSAGQYRRGLSLLALRMDSQSRAGYLVSVSTHDVIRRIKMLSTKESLLNRWQELTVVAGFSIVCLLAAAWTVHADEPVRVASRVSRPAPADGSSVAKTILPWEELGEQDGYAVIRPAAMMQHPGLRNLCEFYFGVIGRVVDLPSFGLNPESIESIQTQFVPQLSRIPQEERAAHDDNEHRLALSANAVIVHTTDAVAWKSFGESVIATIPQLLRSEEEAQFLENELARFDQQPVLRLISHEARDHSSDHSQQLRAAWEQVSNCVLAAATVVPEGAAASLEEEADYTERRALLAAVDVISCGILHDTGAEVTELRFALAPKEGSSTASVVELARRSRDELVSVSRASTPTATDGDSDAEFIHSLIADLSVAEIDVVEADDDRELISLRAHLTADLTTLSFGGSQESAAE